MFYDAVDPLIDLASSTSVFKLGDVFAAATLSEAGFPQFVSVGDDDQDTAIHPRYVQLQVVKRNKQLVLLVNGRRVPTTPNGLITEVNLTAHTGLHRDPISDFAVFSPCAVSLLCEDGERHTTTLTVSVEQTAQAQLGTVGDSTHLGAVSVETTSVCDAVSSVVLAPYPLPFSRQPHVVILDMAAVHRYDLRRIDSTIWSAGALAVGAMKNVILSGVEYFGSSNTPENNGNLGRLANYIRSWFATEAPDRVQATWQTFTQSLGSTAFVVVPGILAVFFMMSGASITAGTFLGVGASFSNNVAQATLTSVVASAAFETAERVSRAMPRPNPVEVSFSLGELADTLLTLSAATRVVDDGDNGGGGNASKDTIASTKAFRREMLVWKWLLEADAPTLLGSITSLYASNPMKFDEFDNAESPVSSVGLVLRLTATDPELCETSGALTWDVTCSRSDGSLLGIAAGGFLDALSRLQAAILTLSKAIDAAIADESYAGKSYWFWDSQFFGPIYRFLKRPFRAFSEADRKQSLELLGVQRKAVLKTVKQHMDEKLIKPFFNVTSSVGRLQEKVLRALRSKWQPLSSPPPATTPHTLRLLPHRASSGIRMHFPTPIALDAETLDATTSSDGSTALSIRQFSKLHDARQELRALLSRSSSALRNVIDSWEGTLTDRCRFVHVHPTTAELANLLAVEAAPPRIRVRPPIDSYSLVLQAPVDVGIAMATAQLTEIRKHQLALVATRHNNTHKSTTTSRVRTRTLLDALGLPNTEAVFVGVSLFGELWTDELVELSLYNSRPRVKVISAVQAASHRAIARLKGCAAFLTQITKRPTAGFLEFDDPALLATEAGRDARRLCTRLHVAQSDDASLEPVANRLREMAEAMRTIVSVFVRGGDPPSTLPSEPLQSLFGDPRDGERAVARVRDVLASLTATGASSATARFVEAAVAASYPSNVLGGTGRPVDPRELATPVPAGSTRAALRHRTAALRVDDVSTDTGLAPKSIDELADRLAGATLAPKTVATFVVPHGYGDAPPPLVVPGTSAPMFGSVPVYVPHLASAAESLISAVRNSLPVGFSAAAPPNGATTIGFQFWPCRALNGGDDGAGPDEYPMFVSKRGDAIRVFGSKLQRYGDRPELPAKGEEAEATPNTPTDLARAFASSPASERFSSDCATIAWNAERVLQAICIDAGTRDESETNLVFDVSIPREPASVDAKTRARTSWKRAQDRAYVFARTHATLLRSLLSEAVELLIASSSSPPAPEPPEDAEPADDAVVPPEEPPPSRPFFDDDSDDAIGFGANAAAAAASPAEKPTRSAADLFHPNSATLLTDFLDAVNGLGSDELAVWASRPLEFETAILEQFPTAPWPGVPDSLRDIQPEFFDRVFTGEAFNRLEQLRALVYDNHADASRIVAESVRQLLDDTETKRIRSSRTALLLSSVVGIAMSIPSTGNALINVDSIVGIPTAVEREMAIRTLTLLRDGLANTQHTTALTLSETSAIVWSVFDAAFTRPSPALPPTPPIPLKAIPRQRLSTIYEWQQVVFEPASMGTEIPEPNVPKYGLYPLIGYRRSANFIAAAGMPRTFSLASPTTPSMLAISSVLARLPEEPGFFTALPERRPLTVDWILGNSGFTVRAPSGELALSLSRWNVIEAMVTDAAYRTAYQFSELEQQQLAAAVASLQVSGQIQALDVALEKTTIVEIDELCDQFEREDVKLMCSILSEAGFERAVQRNQLVYSVPDGWTESGEARLELPGELGAYVQQFGEQAASMALCTLFHLPVQVEWFFDGDTATRPLESPETLRAFSRMRAFVLRNSAILAVMAGISASFALAMYLAASLGVHPAHAISAQDAQSLTADENRLGSLERFSAYFDMPSVTIDITASIPRFVIDLGGVQRAYEVATDLFVTIRGNEQPNVEEGAINVPRTESILERVVTELLYFWFIE